MHSKGCQCPVHPQTESLAVASLLKRQTAVVLIKADLVKATSSQGSWAIFPTDRFQKFITRQRTEGKLATLEWASQASDHTRTCKVKNIAASTEEYVSGRAFPFLYELLVRPHPVHDCKFLTIKIDEARAEIERHTEIGPQE